MKEIFEEIKRLNQSDPASHSDRLCKLTEEVGELAQAINKVNGRKVWGQEDDCKRIIEEIKEEAADCIQNVLSIVEGFEISLDEVLKAIEEKNKKWESKISST